MKCREYSTHNDLFSEHFFQELGGSVHIKAIIQLFQVRWSKEFPFLDRYSYTVLWNLLGVLLEDSSWLTKYLKSLANIS